MNEVLDILESEEFIDANIYLTPPNDDQCSYEDSGDEGDTNAHHFSARQLRSNAEFKIDYSDHIDFSMQHNVDNENVNTDVRNDSSDTEYSALEEIVDVASNVNEALPKERLNYLSSQRPPDKALTWKAKDLRYKNYNNNNNNNNNYNNFPVLNWSMFSVTKENITFKHIMMK